VSEGGDGGADEELEYVDVAQNLDPEGGDGGADEELQYEDVAQNVDQSPEGPNANLASEGKPLSLTLSFKILQLPLL
jgi:hypothetical protein